MNTRDKRKIDKYLQLLKVKPPRLQTKYPYSVVQSEVQTIKETELVRADFETNARDATAPVRGGRSARGRPENPYAQTIITI
jgi:hypothetical protein